MSHPVRSGVPHVLVADVDEPTLDDRDRHHLERVLRLRAGDEFTAGDGAGRWRLCRLAARVEPAGEVVFEPPVRPELAVGFAVLKGGRSEHVVSKLTELGIDRIVPLVSARSVVRPDASRADALLERWQRVAREAVMQCRRPWLPLIEPLSEFAELAVAGAVLAAQGGRALASVERFVLVGPEGGWSDAEMSMVPDHVGLGPNVLRAETAAVAAATLLAARRSHLLPSAATL